MGSEARPGFKQGDGYGGQDLEQHGYHRLYQHPPFASMVFSELPTSLSGLWFSEEVHVANTDIEIHLAKNFTYTFY